MSDWERLTADGRAAADKLITEMIQTENPNLLAQYIRGLLNRNSLTALEVGFFYMLAIRLILRH